jgi:hypothetical protein
MVFLRGLGEFCQLFGLFCPGAKMKKAPWIKDLRQNPQRQTKNIIFQNLNTFRLKMIILKGKLLAIGGSKNNI